jgi:hypothetical protein
MGYSFHTPIRSTEDRDEMFAFLQENYRPWYKIAKYDNDYQGVSEPMSQDMSYGSTTADYPYIGFDFNTGDDGERYWLYNLNYWMAQLIGKKRAWPERRGLEEPVPYVVYDGAVEEDPNDVDYTWPVLERSEFEGKVDGLEWCLVDNGFRGWASMIHRHYANFKKRQLKKGEEVYTEMPEFLASSLPEAEESDVLLKAELARLTELWEARK